jgi:hypothetical protein
VDVEGYVQQGFRWAKSRQTVQMLVAGPIPRCQSDPRTDAKYDMSKMSSARKALLCVAVSLSASAPPPPQFSAKTSGT